MRDYPLITGLSLPPARAAGSTTLARTQDNATWYAARLPPAPSDLTVNLATEMWMKTLPAQVVPAETARRYPRIVNRLARNWEVPQMIEGIFDDLLYAKRRSRKGFPAPVQAEIRALFCLYQARNPRAPGKEDVWYAERMPARR